MNEIMYCAGMIWEYLEDLGYVAYAEDITLLQESAYVIEPVRIYQNGDNVIVESSDMKYIFEKRLEVHNA